MVGDKGIGLQHEKWRLSLLSRRRFLHGVATSSTSILLPSATFAASSSAATAHEYAAAAAAKLAKGRSMTLTLLVPEGSEANILPVTRWFEANAGVSILLRKVPVDEITSRLALEAISSGGDIDLALPASYGIPELADAGVLRPLDDFAARHEPTGYRDSMLYTLADSYGGQLYGYQTDGDIYLMFYQQRWLDDAEHARRFEDRFGEPLSVPSTWEELDRLMAFFHRPDEGLYGGALFRTPLYMAWEWWIRFHAKGRWPFDADMAPQIHLDSGVEALEELIAASAHLYPGAASDGLFENWAAYRQGNIFCNIGWGGTLKALNQADSKVRGALAFGPTPGGVIDGQLIDVPYFNWGWNYTVSKTSREPEISYLFALCACSPAMSTLAVRESGGYFDPFRREHYDDPAIVDVYGPSFLAVHQRAMSDAVPDLYLPDHGRYLDALRTALLRAYRREATPEQALALAARQWRQITRQRGEASQIARWQELRSAYPRALKKRLS